MDSLNGNIASSSVYIKQNKSQLKLQKYNK